MHNRLGAILVGGRARRLGGIPKGLITHNNQSLIRRTIDVLSPYCDQVVLVGNSEQYAHLNLPSIVDAYQDTGPLSGLAAALDATLNEVLLVPCDLPNLAASIFERLIQHPGPLPVACRDPYRTHPLIARYPKSVSTIVHRYARSSGSAHGAFVACGGQWLTFEREELFTNVNTPEDLALL